MATHAAARHEIEFGRAVSRASLPPLTYYVRRRDIERTTPAGEPYPATLPSTVPGYSLTLVDFDALADGVNDWRSYP